MPLKPEEMKHLADTMEGVIDGLDGLRGELKRRNRTFAIVGALFLSMILGVGGVNYSVNHSNQDVIDTINSCATPDGECYKRLQANQASGSSRSIYLDLICDSIPPERRVTHQVCTTSTTR